MLLWTNFTLECNPISYSHCGNNISRLISTRGSQVVRFKCGKILNEISLPKRCGIIMVKQPTLCLHPFTQKDSICVWVCHFLTFNLNSRGVGSGGLLPPSSPVLTQTLGLGNKGAQGVLLEPVRVLEGEPLPILPLGEHKFHYIDFFPPRCPQDSNLKSLTVYSSKFKRKPNKVSPTLGEKLWV